MDRKRYSDYTDWRNIGVILFNIATFRIIKEKTMKSIYRNFSVKWEKFNEKNFNNDWESIKKQIQTSQKQLEV